MRLIKEIKFSGNSGLRVKSNLLNAGLHVIGNDEQEPKLKIELDSITKLKEEEDLGEYIQVDFDEESNILEMKQTSKRLPHSLHGMKLELTVPLETEISSESVNGGVKVENIHLDQDYELTNGGIKSISCIGRLEIRSTNGGLKILDHEGKLDIEQTNGGISVQDSKGTMHIKNINGGIKLNHCRGTLNVENRNGGIKVLNSGIENASIKAGNSNVYYEFDKIEEGQFDFSNSHGKISLIIPKELPYKIKAKTSHGKVMIGLDKDYEQKGEGEKEFKIVNGAGSVEINIENHHGSIILLDEIHAKEDIESKVSRKIETILKSKVIPTIEKLTKENAPKIQKQLHKAGEKLSKIEINIPEIETKVKNTLDQVSETIKVTLDENADDIEKYKDMAIDKVNKTIDNVTDFVTGQKEKAETEHEKPKSTMREKQAKNVEERSKLKILELLEIGKITPQEAEKLLKALNKHEE